MAVILTVSFFWIPVACMTRCTADSVEEQMDSTTLMPDGINPSQDRDCCPLTTVLPSVLPEHRVTVVPPNNHQQATLVVAVQLATPSFLRREHTATPDSKSDPPFKRLRSLRI